MTIDELVGQIRNGAIGPAYYFQGDDDYRMHEATRFLVENYLPPNLRATNVARLDMNSRKIGDALNELSALGFFAEKKVIVMMDPQKLAPTDCDRLVAALKSSAPERVVILITRAEKKQKKDSRFFKTINAVVPVVDFPRLTPTEMATRLRRRLAEAKVTANPEAMRRVVENLDGDLGRFTAEADKLALYALESGELTVAMVDEVSSTSKQQSVYDLVAALTARNAPLSLEILERLLADGESPTGVLFWIGEQYSNLYMIKCGQGLDGSRRWLETKLAPQARAMDKTLLESAISQVYFTEARLKGGVGVVPAVSDNAALRELIISLCEGATAKVSASARSGVGDSHRDR